MEEEVNCFSYLTVYTVNYKCMIIALDKAFIYFFSPEKYRNLVLQKHVVGIH